MLSEIQKGNHNKEDDKEEVGVVLQFAYSSILI
jgi:hypothetical protein